MFALKSKNRVAVFLRYVIEAQSNVMGGGGGDHLCQKIFVSNQYQCLSQKSGSGLKMGSFPMVNFVRFLYNRLALFFHRDSHLLSTTLPWQLLSVIKVELFHQILHFII